MSRRGFAAPLIFAIVIAFLVIVGGAYFVGRTRISSPTLSSTSTPIPSQPSSAPTSSTWQTYRNANSSIEFQYPTDFAFSANPSVNRLKEPLVELVSSAIIPKTNLIERIFSVSWEAGKSDETCLQNPQTMKPMNATKTVNGVTFSVGVMGGVAAGNIYSSTIYRTVRNGSCFEVLLTVHTANINNYPVSAGIREVDPLQAMAPLEQIFTSFQFKG